jgi:hypothetical protein
VNRDKVEREIANEVFGLKPGETSAPVRDAQGWHVLQSVERKPRLAPMFESLRPILRTDLESEKAKVYMERVLSQLRAKVGIHYDTANAEFASRKFVTTRTLEGAENFGTTLTIDAQLPEFSDQDTSRLIARWKGGGRFSIGNLVHEYSHIPPVVRPSLNDSYAILAFVESLLLEPDIAEYGAERGLEKDSTVVRSIAKKREELMVEHLYQDSVASKVWVSKEERRAYYDKNLQSFFTYPAVDFAAFVRNSKAGADSVERALRSGASARAMLAADSAAGRYEGSVQHRLQSEGGPYHTALFEEMRPGDVQVRGPDRKGDYAILQLLKFDGGRQLSYAESELMIDESLQNLKTEQALQALIARHQKKYAIASRPEMVMRIKLLDATLYQ